MGERAEAVDVGVAEVDGEGVVAVPLLHPHDELGGAGEGHVPRRLAQLAVGVTHERAPQPVGVVLEVGQDQRLRADVTSRERVAVVTPDTRDRPVRRHRDLEPAHRLAQGAGHVPDLPD